MRLVRRVDGALASLTGVAWEFVGESASATSSSGHLSHVHFEDFPSRSHQRLPKLPRVRIPTPALLRLLSLHRAVVLAVEPELDKVMSATGVCSQAEFQFRGTWPQRLKLEAAVLSLRCKLCALGVGAEPGFNEKVGDYGAWGAVGSPGTHLYTSLPTHVMLRGQLRLASVADVATVMGGGGGTSLWINSNCDHAMEEFAVVFATLIPQLQAARCFTAQTALQRVAEEQRGGRRWPITVISLVGITGVFMGVDPSTFSANLAGTLRALNDYLPAHTDPDGHWEVTNLYVRGTSPGPQRQGCVLHVADGSRGGRVSTYPTDPGHPMRVRQVDFCPTRLLHWVESEPGTEGRGDEGFVRHIPFDNVWLASKILGDRGLWVCGWLRESR